MSVVTNKIIGSKTIMDSEFHLKTIQYLKYLQMYCGLHFNSAGLIITREIPCVNNI
jgi:hypothetical protein